MAAFLDGCRFNPAAGGTTDWTYASAVTGYQSPAAANVVNGRLYKYRAESTDLSQWEFGEGAYSTATGVLARTTVLYNSSGTTSKINFTSVPQVAIVALKEDLVSVDEANSFSTAQKAQACANIGVTAIGQAVVGQIPGTTGTTQPAASFVAEMIVNNTVSVTSTTSGLIVSGGSLTLTPGVWDIEGQFVTGGPGATTTTDILLAITTTAGSISSPVGGQGMHHRMAGQADLSVTFTQPRSRVAISANTTYFMNFQPTFSGASYSCSGWMRGTRVS